MGERHGEAFKNCAILLGPEHLGADHRFSIVNTA